MSVLARNSWTAQARLDVVDMLSMESYLSFDLRSLVSAFSGVDKTYILRGLEVTAKTGLTVTIKVADCMIFNPKDGSGSFYMGLVDDAAVQLALQANQANLYVEAKFVNQTQVPVTKGFWDPLALSGDQASGTEFTASADTQSVLVLQISANTVGFTEGAVPLFKASTGASSITSMVDCRPLLFRLGTGGTVPNPLNKFPFSTVRGEPVPSGTGVGNETDSPWKSSDGNGAVNDKALKTFKEWADAVMTRIAEISGSSLWYNAGISTAPAANVSLYQLFFDTIGSSIEPSSNAAFKWKRVSGNLTLAGEGEVSGSPKTTGLIKWKSNYSGLMWHLGDTFVSNVPGGSRSYTSVRFAAPSPVDGGNTYLKLEREVPKGSGAPVNWASNASYGGFVATKTVSGVAGDFSGIAIGDYIRKQSEGYSRYYKVAKTWDGSTVRDDISNPNYVSDSTTIALELSETIISGASTEPLFFFRSRYGSADLYSDTVAGVHNFQDANFLWLGRRAGDLFILKDYGTMQEGEEVVTIDHTWAKGDQGGGAGLLLQHENNSVYDSVSGYSLKTGTGDLITIRRHKRNNTVESPTVGTDNTDGWLTYTIAAPVGTIANGSGLWVRLSDTVGGPLTAGVVTNSTDDLNNSDVTTNKWEVRTAANNPANTFDNKDVFLLARKTVIGGVETLIFSDSSILDNFGVFISNSLSVQGDLKIDTKPVTAVPFISAATAGLIDFDDGNFNYDKTLGKFTARTFTVEDDVIDTIGTTDVEFLPSLGARTLNVGHADSTTRILGDLEVMGDYVALNVQNILSEDGLITLGVGNVLNGGFGNGIEIADNTQNATTAVATGVGVATIDVTFGSAHGYVLTDIVGIKGVTDVSGIVSGQIGGQYTVVATASVEGEAEIISPTIIRLWTRGTSTNTTPAASPLSSFKPEWSWRLGSSAGAYTGITSWIAKVKSGAFAGITPVSGYSIVPTAHTSNMLAGRIPFVGNDNAGPAGVDTTLDFDADLAWDGTNLVLGGGINPSVDNTYDLGQISSPLRWRRIHLGDGASSGVQIGSVIMTNPTGGNLLNISGVPNMLDWFQVDQLAANTVPSVLPLANGINVFAASGLLWQQTSDGNVSLLTNKNGSIYQEIVDVVTVPSGNNQTAPIASPPATVTIPKNTKELVGQNLVCNVSIGTPDVVVTLNDHTLGIGDLITVITTTAVGGISAVNLSVTNAAVTATTTNTFTYTAGAAATSTASGTLDRVTAILQKVYTVGIDELEIFLNNVYLQRGVDWAEVGTVYTQSTQVEILRDLVDGDVLTYRIDSNGGAYIINMAGGTSLQSAYNAGPNINITSGVPMVLNGTGNLATFNGDITVTGLIL